MKPVAWSIIGIVAIIVIIGLFGHVLVLAAAGGGGFLVGRGYERGTKAIGRRRTKKAIGS